jgi:hypothetical protein
MPPESVHAEKATPTVTANIQLRQLVFIRSPSFQQ